jgi:hypothetical protein
MISDYPPPIDNHSTPLLLAILSWWKDSEAFPRLLFNVTEFTPSLGYYRGSAKGFIIWQEALDPTYYQRPLEERFIVANQLAWRNGSGVFRTALDRSSVLHPSIKENCEILHTIAGVIVSSWALLYDITEHSSRSDYETHQAELRGNYERNGTHESPR